MMRIVGHRAIWIRGSQLAHKLSPIFWLPREHRYSIFRVMAMSNTYKISICIGNDLDTCPIFLISISFIKDSLVREKKISS